MAMINPCWGMNANGRQSRRVLPDKAKLNNPRLTPMPIDGTGATLGASGPLNVCRLLVRERLALVLWGATGQTFDASGEIPETCRVFAREKPILDR